MCMTWTVVVACPSVLVPVLCHGVCSSMNYASEEPFAAALRFSPNAPALVSS